MTRKRRSQSAIGLLSFLVAVFALTMPASAEWKEKVLYSFQGSPDGSFPGGGLVFDKAGNLYGVTLEGGSGSCPPAQCGIVYQLSPPAQKGGPWTETVLYVFKGQHYGDGSSPAGTLLIDSSGNLYGGTGYGGTGECMIFGGVVGCGTVYELSPPKKQGEAWTEKVLYSFKGGKDGQLAGESLTFDAQGNIYGATAYGGGYGSCNEPYYQHCGAIYEVSPPKTKGGKWTEKVLYGFKGVKSGNGANPNGGLVLDTKGAIYGTTYIGGYNCPHNSGQGCGTVFELMPRSKKGVLWKEKIMHRFKASADGANPAVGMIFDKKGYLYGTSDITVFRMTPPKTGSGPWKQTILYTFNSDAYNPEGALIFDNNGYLYGTTNVGSGRSLQGSVFRLKPPNEKGDAWNFTLIHGFLGPPDGDFPAADLVFDQGGNLYSTTQGGGTGTSCPRYCGTVFEVSP
jgi:hypothetical protein